MKGYNTYKDSGFEWIGKIPENWQTIQLIHYTSVIGGSTPKSNVQEYWDGEINWITTDDLGKVKGKTINHSRRTITKEGLANCSASLIKANSVIISCRAPIGHLAINTVETATNQGCKAIEIIKGLKTEYLYYYLFHAKADLQSLGTGSTFMEISASILKKYKILKPSLIEQTKIANYLDHKTAIIDALIEKREQLIQKLQAKRQAIINEAITKGLNPNAKMKDSGIEWLGEIPEHWFMVKLTWLTEFITCGLAATPKYVEDDEGVPFLSAQNVKPGIIKLHKYRFISKELHQKLTKIRKPQKGDLLVTRVGAGIGEAAVVDIDFEFSVYVSLTHIRTNEKLFTPFLMYFFATEYAKNLALQGTVEGGGQGNLNVKNVENYRIALPTLEEQKNIVETLNTSLKKIDGVIKQSEQSIKKLKSYRESIISEAVTGKIDVRDWQAPKA